jgi:hypothetical protein
MGEAAFRLMNSTMNKLATNLIHRGQFSANCWIASLSLLAACVISAPTANADTTPVAVLDPNLEVTTFVSGLSQPIGLAFLSPDCRYLQINQRLTDICGISVEDHLGRYVRDCVPALADAVEGIVAHGDGAVMLLHPWTTATGLALPSIIEAVRARGGEFVRLDALP